MIRKNKTAATKASPRQASRTEAARADSPQPATSIGFLLQRSHNLLRESLLAALEGTGLHLGHIAILGFLEKEGGLTQKDLSARTGIEKSSMVIFLDHLEHEGWIARKAHPTDRRAHAVFLTPRGASQLKAIGPRLTKAEQDFLKPLSSSEQEILRTHLSTLVNL